MEKKIQKKIPEIFHEFFLNFLLGYRGSVANLGYACKNLGGLGPLIWEEIDPAQTVVNVVSIID
jgi:hypothetical protein